MTVAAVSPDAFALLVTAGVQVLHPDPPHPPGHPLTIDDLIDLHRLLDTQDWFTQLQRLH